MCVCRCRFVYIWFSRKTSADPEIYQQWGEKQVWISCSSTVKHKGTNTGAFFLFLHNTASTLVPHISPVPGAVKCGATYSRTVQEESGHSCTSQSFNAPAHIRESRTSVSRQIQHHSTISMKRAQHCSVCWGRCGGGQLWRNSCVLTKGYWSWGFHFSVFYWAVKYWALVFLKAENDLTHQLYLISQRHTLLKSVTQHIVTLKKSLFQFFAIVITGEQQRLYTQSLIWWTVLTALQVSLL